MPIPPVAPSTAAHAHARLSDLAGPAMGTDQCLHIALVTPDILGPVRNGGIGTACTYLAYALADYGHEVHILFSQTGAGIRSSDDWLAEYTDRGIRVVSAEAWDAERGNVLAFPNHPPLYMAHVVHDWLASHEKFDLVLFMEWQGSGFYAMHAKACGLRFQNTVLATVVHSPSLWHVCNNAEAPVNPLQSCTWHMERTCVAMADAVISPSAYMLDWCREHQFQLPEHAFVQPNILELPSEVKNTHTTPVQELVFFGRLEYRKGLEQFCAALDILARGNQLPQRVTFLGKCAWMEDEHAALYIARRAEAWGACKISFRLHDDHHQAIRYLCGPGRLAVMPSVSDNSPYTVYECLAAGIPFLARDVGGIAELIQPEDARAVLCGDNPHDLAARLHAAIGQVPFRAQLAVEAASNRLAWCEGLAKLTHLVRTETNAKSFRAAEPPFISVCLTHYNRPHFLRQAVDSLLAQDTSNFEVILADDGSTDSEALALLDTLSPLFQHKGWRILRLANGYPAKARNSAAQEAKGAWLLFFDDDNIAMPHMVRSLAHAARYSDTSVIVPMFDVFESDTAPSPENRKERFLPTGNAVAYSTIHNILADTTSLICRQAFRRVGGFREDYGLGHEDFELFLRMILVGEPVGIIPESLFWYRRVKGSNSVQRHTPAAANRMRSLRPFMELWPAPLAELALMTHGLAASQGLYDVPDADTTRPSVRRGPKDPQDDAVLAQVASVLAHNGQPQLAEQVLDALQDTALGTSTQTRLLCARARDVANSGNVLHIRQCLSLLKSRSPKDQVALCITMLHYLPETKKLRCVRGVILKVLKAVGDDRLVTHLFLARYLSHAEAPLAADHFCRALAHAESQYLGKREDVAVAVKKGSFLCALHHYALHGEIDKALWPEKHLFSQVLDARTDIFSTLCATHMDRYRYSDVHLAQNLLTCLRENTNVE